MMNTRRPISPLASGRGESHVAGAIGTIAVHDPCCGTWDGKVSQRPEHPGRRRVMIAPGHTLIALTALVTLLLLLSQPLFAQTTIDFEGFNGPPVFTGIEPPLSVGIATFSGGQRLTATVNLPANQTTVYGTAYSPLCNGCLDTITIDFSQAVSNLSLKVINGQTFTVGYTVQDNTEGSQVFSLQGNSQSGQATVTLPSTGITQVTVTSDATQWDFFIDDIQFGVPVITPFASGLNFPFGVAVDATGNVYVADRNNHKVRKFSPSGVEASPVAGTGEAGYNGDSISAATAQLNSPTGVAVRNGDLFIADSGNNIIRKVAGGIISTVAGVTVGRTPPNNSGVAVNGGLATEAELFNPRGVAVDSYGNIYIADTMNQQVRKVDAGTGIISAVAGTGTGETGNVDGPVAGSKLNSPLSVAVDIYGSVVIIADEGNDSIRMVVAGEGGPEVQTLAAGTLDSPSGVAVDGNGNLYIADTDNHRIKRVYGPSVTTVAGGNGEGSAGDGGAATAAQLNSPVAVAVDPTCQFLYIADLINNKIRKVDFTTAGCGVPQ